jgi:hypothetical protein
MTEEFDALQAFDPFGAFGLALGLLALGIALSVGAPEPDRDPDAAGGGRPGRLPAVACHGAVPGLVRPPGAGVHRVLGLIFLASGLPSPGSR